MSAVHDEEVFSPAPPSAPKLEPVDESVPKHLRKNVHLANAARRQIAELEQQREAVLSRVKQGEVALLAAQTGRANNQFGTDHKHPDQLKAELKLPREELAKIDAEIRRFQKTIDVVDYLLANPPQPETEQEPDHPVIEERKEALRTAEREYADAQKADDRAATQLEAAEVRLANDKSLPEIRIDNYSGARTELERPVRKAWLDAQEAQIKARHHLREAENALAAARAELADSAKIERAIAKHDQKSAEVKRERATRTAHQKRVREVGTMLAMLIKEAHAIDPDPWEFRKALNEAIQAAGVEPWDARGWLKPA
ncbi:MAG TPA: hypothetical protein VJT73_16735 [Polyangiaceae bacterium]|nr:hypothetical protein [Polyangiaceae bacterium]